MTSSKFSQKPPPFKVPAVCKKKLLPGGPPPPEGDPLPADPCNCEFHIHGTWLGQPVDRDGDLPMDKLSEILWRSLVPAPPNGEIVDMHWNEDALRYAGIIRLYKNGNYWMNFVLGTTQYELDSNFDTGEFDWFNVLFVGSATGRYHNAL